MSPKPSPSDVPAEVEALRARIGELERGLTQAGECPRSLLMATLNSTTDGLLVVDSQGRILFYNRKFLQMWGIPEQLAATSDNRRVVEFVLPQLADADDFVRRSEELTAHPEQEGLDEIAFRDGRLFERYSKAQPTGPVIGRVWCFRDVTQQRQAEQRLRESEARYRDLFSSAPVSIWEHDFSEVARWLERLRAEGVTDLREYLAAHPEGTRYALGLVRVLDVNEASLPVFEADSREALIEKYRELFTDESGKGVNEQLIAVWERRERMAGEITGVTLKGRRADFLMHWVVPSRGGKPDLGHVIIALDDITERVRLERELLRSQKLESIGTLAGGIAHDFNNLLAVIVGQASMQLRDRALSARARDTLKDIMHAAERGSSLTQQLLAYARGGLQKPVPVDLNAIIGSVMKILRRTTPPQVEAVLRLAPDLPPIMADPSQIEQVIMNLCLNAVQASTVPGRVEVTTELADVNAGLAARWALSPGVCVCLRVRDFGAGMDPATVDRIFEPFFTTKPTGRGMGLAVTLGIVKSHSGHIEVDSAPGAGTTMSVWLPAARGPQATAGTSPPRPRTAAPPRGTETLLVIDDDPAVSRTVSTMLSSLGYCVVAHADADEALAFVKSNAEDIHLVLLDANMPKYSSAALLQRIRRHCPQVPLLLASGFDLGAQGEDILREGVDGFVQKPFSLMTLATAIRAALDGAAPRGEAGGAAL